MPILVVTKCQGEISFAKQMIMEAQWCSTWFRCYQLASVVWWQVLICNNWLLSAANTTLWIHHIYAAYFNVSLLQINVCISFVSCLWPPIQYSLSFCSVFGLHHILRVNIRLFSCCSTLSCVHQLIANFGCLLFRAWYESYIQIYLPTQEKQKQVVWASAKIWE